MYNLYIYLYYLNIINNIFNNIYLKYGDYKMSGI